MDVHAEEQTYEKSRMLCLCVYIAFWGKFDFQDVRSNSYKIVGATKITEKKSSGEVHFDLAVTCVHWLQPDDEKVLDVFFAISNYEKH